MSWQTDDVIVVRIPEKKKTTDKYKAEVLKLKADIKKEEAKLEKQREMWSKDHKIYIEKVLLAKRDVSNEKTKKLAIISEVKEQEEKLAAIELKAKQVRNSVRNIERDARNRLSKVKERENIVQSQYSTLLKMKQDTAREEKRLQVIDTETVARGQSVVFLEEDLNKKRADIEIDSVKLELKRTKLAEKKKQLDNVSYELKRKQEALGDKSVGTKVLERALKTQIESAEKKYQEGETLLNKALSEKEKMKEREEQIQNREMALKIVDRDLKEYKKILDIIEKENIRREKENG